MEQKKLLGILISVGVFLIIVAATGLFIFYPKNAGDKTAQTKSVPALVTASGSAVVEPDEWVRKPEALPGLESAKPQVQTEGKIQAGEPKEDMVVVYGEKPPISTGAQDARPSTSASVRDGNLTVNVSVQPVPVPQAVPAEAQRPAAPQTKPAVKSAAKPQATASTAKKAEPKKIQVAEYWIQAGSFKSKAKAEETKQLLAKKGLVAVIMTFDLDGTTYYRVRIGPYPSQPEANGWLAQMKAISGFESSYVSKVMSARTAN